MFETPAAHIGCLLRAYTLDKVYLFALHKVSTNNLFLSFSEWKDVFVTKDVLYQNTTSFSLGHRWDIYSWLLEETSDL